VCITLGELPTIRFDDKGIPARTTGTVARALAEAVQAKLLAAKEEDTESFVRTSAAARVYCVDLSEAKFSAVRLAPLQLFRTTAMAASARFSSWTGLWT